MAGRLKGLLERVQRMGKQIGDLYNELGGLEAKYNRMRGEFWSEHIEEARQGLSKSEMHLQILERMARDLVSERGTESMLPDNDSESATGPIQADFCPHPLPIAGVTPIVTSRNRTTHSDTVTLEQKGV